jgi:acetyl esterase/lipase
MHPPRSRHPASGRRGVDKSLGRPLPQLSQCHRRYVQLSSEVRPTNRLNFADNSQDYLPTHGFQHKPSAAWPPPNASDLAALESPDAAPEQEPHAKNPKEYIQNRKSDIKAAKGFVVVPPDAPPPSGKNSSIVIDDVRIRIDDQIQIYTTNALISHPLVSPILQSSLGGLCPLFILSGGGEVLRDEQIYLAHKAAYPEKYPTWEGHVKDDPRQVETLEKFKTGTKVLLQVWEGCCHVVPALAWTKPAKKMFREVAKFSQWAFEEAAGDDGGSGRAQPDVDTASLASSAYSTTSSSNDATGEEEEAAGMGSSSTSQSLLDPDSMLTAFSVSTKGMFTRFSRKPHPLPPDQIGVLTPEPVKRWMEAKKIWDERYAKEKRRVQRRRMKEMVELGKVGGDGDDDGERPPPSAAVGRKKGAVNGAEEGVSKLETNWGLSMWAGWGGKHDKRMVGKNGKRIAGEAKRRDKMLGEARKSEGSDGEKEEVNEGVNENMRRDREGDNQKREEVGNVGVA